MYIVISKDDVNNMQSNIHSEFHLFFPRQHMFYEHFRGDSSKFAADVKFAHCLMK